MGGCQETVISSLDPGTDTNVKTKMICTEISS